MASPVNSTAEPEDPLEERRFRFRLIDLFAVTAVICVCLAIYVQWGVWSIPVVLAIVGVPVGIYSRRRRLLKWSEVLVIGAILFVLAGLVLPSGPSLGPQSRRDMYRVRLAFRHYELNQGGLPPVATSASGVRFSWRVLIMEYDLGRPLTLDRSLPWDDPANATATEENGYYFRCWGDRSRRISETSFVAITGPDTCWPDEGLARDDIPDGESNTLLVVDSHRTGITWTEPRDLKASELNWQINAGPQSIHAGHGRYVQYLDGSRRITGTPYTNALMADGSMRSLSANMNPTVLQELVNRHDGKPER